MIYKEFLPSPRLSPYVKLIWCLELDSPGDFGPPERIAPDSIVEMIFHYRVPMAVRFAGEAYVVQPRSSVISQTRRFVEILPRGPTGLISIRFRPGGGYHFFRAPVSAFSDRLTLAEDLWGDRANEIEERLAGAADIRERVDLVEQFLLRLLREHEKADVAPLVRMVWNRKGQVRVAQLCRELGLTEKGMERIFTAALGMPPKRFARLTRFLHACTTLRRGIPGTLTQAGYDCGYYDQAHFIGDFKAFSGMTPGEFSASRSLSFLEVV